MSKDICNNDNLTKEEKWRAIVGTEYYGNLPIYKVNDHVGHCWNPCPYSTDCSDDRTRLLLGLSDTDPLPLKVEHVDNGKKYYMKTSSRNVYGFECTFDNCPHFINNGIRYFTK